MLSVSQKSLKRQRVPAVYCTTLRLSERTRSGGNSFRQPRRSATGHFVRRGLSADEVLDRSERDIYEIADQSSGRDDPQVLSDVLADLVEKLEKNIGNTNGVSGLATGFADLDETTTGFQPADLVVVAGRPGMGKTSFALNIAEQVVMDDPEGAVLFFSLEQPSSQLGLRVLSSLSGINMQKLRQLQLGAARVAESNQRFRTGGATALVSVRHDPINHDPDQKPGSSDPSRKEAASTDYCGLHAADDTD